MSIPINRIPINRIHINSQEADDTIKMVASWFTPLKLNGIERDATKRTLLDIFEYKDKSVKSKGEWEPIFFILFRLFRSYGYGEMYKSEFKKMCLTANITDEELNNMTLEEFVYLFAGKMPEIFENEKKLQKDYDDAAAAGSSTGSGGSKNKSRKRSTRKPRGSRRHRRRTTTRKYKKLYK